MPNTRTFIPLNGPPIKQCGELLPNKMQCLRAGEFIMTLSSSSGVLITEYQVCLRHKLVILSQDATNELIQIQEAEERSLVEKLSDQLKTAQDELTQIKQNQGA